MARGVLDAGKLDMIKHFLYKHVVPACQRRAIKIILKQADIDISEDTFFNLPALTLADTHEATWQQKVF